MVLGRVVDGTLAVLVQRETRSVTEQPPDGGQMATRGGEVEWGGAVTVSQIWVDSLVFHLEKRGREGGEQRVADLFILLILIPIQVLLTEIPNRQREKNDIIISNNSAHNYSSSRQAGRQPGSQWPFFIDLK